MSPDGGGGGVVAMSSDASLGFVVADRAIQLLPSLAAGRLSEFLSEPHANTTSCLL